MKNHLNRLFIILFLLLLLTGAGFAVYSYLRVKTIFATVLDSQNHRPVVEAVIEAGKASVAKAGETHSTQSEAGVFEIKLDSNPLSFIPLTELRASAPGYLPRQIFLFVPWWRIQQEVKIHLEPTQVAGRVADALTGDSLSAIIYVTNGQTAAKQEPIVTNDEGVFQLLRLEPRSLLRVEVPGYEPWQAQLDSPALYTDTSLRPLEIKMLPYYLAGKVSDAWTGDPLLANIYVIDSHSSSEELRQILADDNGYFQAVGLDPPTTLRVDAPGYESWQTQLNSLEPLRGNSIDELEINLVPRTTTGVLRAADTDEPLAGITLTAASDDRRQTVTTDANGRFEFQRLLPGDPITIPATAGYLPAEAIFSDQSELILSLQPRRATVTLGDSFTGGKAVGVQLTFDQTLTATTNAQGQATFSRIPSSGQIAANQPGYYPATVDYQGSESVDMLITPSALQGVVRDRSTGQPLPQATLYLGNTILHADDDGYFYIEQLPLTLAEPLPIVVKAAGYHRAYAQLDQTGIITGYTPSFTEVEGRWLDIAPCAEASARLGPPCLDVKMEPFQAKAIYIPFQYLHNRESMIGYLDFVAATELNAVVVDVKGDFGYIAWNSEVDLVKEVGADEWFTDTWMPLDEFIAEAKARNIYTIARFVVFKDNPLAHGKPEWAAVREDGTVWLDREELGWANPFREEVWEYNISLAKEVAALGFDELNFDYIRFPSDGDIGAIVYEEENTLETRTAAIREFMKQLTEALRPYGVFVSADVFGLTLWVVPESDMSIGQRLIDIAPYVDYLAPMVYPSTFIPGNLGYDDPSAEPYNIVFRSQKQAEQLVPPYVKVRPWLQGYWYSLDEMRLLKQAAVDAESVGWSWWNAGGKYDGELFEPADEEDVGD